MSIDEVMDAAAEYRDAPTFSGQCVAKVNLRAAITQHVAEAVAAERERWRPVLDAVVREMAHKGEHRGNAPGHAHATPGVWDSDNGPRSGTACSWCSAWKIACELLAQEQTL